MRVTVKEVMTTKAISVQADAPLKDIADMPGHRHPGQGPAAAYTPPGAAGGGPGCASGRVRQSAVFSC